MKNTQEWSKGISFDCETGEFPDIEDFIIAIQKDAIKDLEEENKIYAGHLDAAIEDYNKEKSKVDTLTRALNMINKRTSISGFDPADLFAATAEVNGISEQALEKVSK